MFDPGSLADYCWRMAVEHRGQPAAQEFMRGLRKLPEQTILEAAESLLHEVVEGLWVAGWQPAELRRQGRLGCSGSGARLISMLIAVDHARRRATTLDSRWVAQVDGLELPATNGRAGWLEHWARAEGLGRDQGIEVVLDALATMVTLPALQPLLPPPGGQALKAPTSTRGEQADPVLQRVRNLLAKAESTTFEAEATTFTAKAQELITRHAIDEALLADGSAAARSPVEMRLPVDAPYADVKSLLLQTVAESGRCRAVFMPRLSMSTLIGYSDDVTAVEMLFTSLLVQAQHALSAAARNAAPGTRTRQQSYRSAFLLAFTQRIGQRLREINEAVLSAAQSEHGSGFLPVLSSMADAVEDYTKERFGELSSSAVRGGYDSAGWVGGRLAADSAKLSFGEVSDPGFERPA